MSSPGVSGCESSRRRKLGAEDLADLRLFRVKACRDGRSACRNYKARERQLARSVDTCARSALPGLAKIETRLRSWLGALLERAKRNVIVVALVNKLARIV